MCLSKPLCNIKLFSRFLYLPWSRKYTNKKKASPDIYIDENQSPNNKKGQYWGQFIDIDDLKYHQQY